MCCVLGSKIKRMLGASSCFNGGSSQGGKEILGAVGGVTIVGSLSNFNGYSLATTVPIVSTLKLRYYPVPATMLSGRANFRDFCYSSFASGVSFFADR